MEARRFVGGLCDVRDHGATGTRAQNATAPVQKAVDACHARGGGTVYVPPGEYTTGTIVLKDNVTLWLEAGAVFYLSQDEALVISKARDVELSGFVARSARGTDLPAVVIEGVDGALVRGCRSLGGEFLRVDGESRAIRVTGDDFSAAAVPVSYGNEGLRSAVTLEGNLSGRQ